MTSAAFPPCDRSQASAAPSRNDNAGENPGWILTASILASSLAFVDGSVVNVALPAIGRSFDAGAAELQWIINAYLLPLSALLLLGGAAGDHFGRRRLLIAGIAVFAAASLACALAPGSDMLLAARGLQGIGAAMLMPNSLAVLGNAFAGDARGRAIGTWAAAGAVAGAVGPPLGGWLVEVAGWRSIFFLNIPLAAAAGVIAWRFVPESATGERALDWAGAALATVALGALTWGLTLWSSRHAVELPAAIGIALGTLALALFLWTEHRRGEHAMMPLTLFASRPFVGLTLLTFMLYGALGGLFVLLPYLLIRGGGYSSLMAGVALLPAPIIMGLGSRAMGALAERVGPRLPLSIGPLLVGVGFALLMRVDPEASYWTSILPGLAVVALGMAGAVAPLTTTVLSSVDDRHTGTASGFNSAVARTGGLIATALAGAVIAQDRAGLVTAFRTAALIAAMLAWASAAAAWFTLPAKARR